MNSKYSTLCGRGLNNNYNNYKLGKPNKSSTLRGKGLNKNKNNKLNKNNMSSTLCRRINNVVT